MAFIDDLHNRMDSLLGDQIGFGVAAKLIEASFAAYIVALNKVPQNWVPIGAIPLGAKISFVEDPAKSNVKTGASNKPLFTCALSLSVIAKDDPTKVFRNFEVTCADVPVALAFDGTSRMRFQATTSIDPTVNPVGKPDQTLIDDKNYYGGDLTRYLSHETAILLNLSTLLNALVEQIPFPNILSHMSVLTMGPDLNVYYDQDYMVVASKRPQFTLPECIHTPQVMNYLTVTAAEVPAADLSGGPTSRSAMKLPFTIDHTPPPVKLLHKIDPPDSPENLGAFLYYAKSVGFDVAAGSVATKIAYKEKNSDESFFVRWWYSFSAAIKSAKVLFELAPVMRLKVNVQLTGDGTAAGTIKIGCVDIASAVVVIDGTIDGELLIALDKTSTLNYRDVRLTATLTASNAHLSLIGLGFPLNLVINLILSLITSGFGRQTVAKMVAAFNLPLLRTEEAFARIPLYPWISRQHLTAKSHLVSLSRD